MHIPTNPIANDILRAPSAIANVTSDKIESTNVGLCEPEGCCSRVSSGQGQIHRNLPPLY